MGFHVDESDPTLEAKFAEATELKLDMRQAEAIWQQLITPTQLTTEERRYENHLQQLSDLNIPKDAFIASARAKALEMGVDNQRAEFIWGKFTN